MRRLHSSTQFPPSFMLNRLDCKANEYGNERTTQAGQCHLWRNPSAPRLETNCAGFTAHRYRRLRFASVRPERAHCDVTLLQYGDRDASAGPAAAPEPWSGCARLLAD